jgi:sigma-B regulation protein RsbU (phosphoserine phosphatase)
MRSGGAVEPVEVAGPLIGMAAGSEYPAARFSLGPGDSMLLYTDGLTDAQAPERILSDSDLIDLLSACQGLGGDELLAFIERRATQGSSVRDDIALLLVEFLGT